jgi:hypothetical protein
MIKKIKDLKRYLENICKGKVDVPFSFSCKLAEGSEEVKLGKFISNVHKIIS